MKKWVPITLIVMFVITLCSACGKAKETDSLVKEDITSKSNINIEHKKLKIALVMKTLTNPFFVEMEKGARKAEADLGIELLVKTGAKETSIQQQIQIVDELIDQKVDAIVIAPGSSTELVNVLKQAQDANIKIVNIDNRLDIETCKKEGLKNVPFISVKNDEGAYLSVKEICDSKDSTPRDAIIFEGIREAENAELRKEGAQKAFGENPNVKIVASESANWKIDEAYELSKKFFKKYPKTSLIFCANDMMALGVVQYIKENNLKGIKVSGFDDLDDAQKAIKDGFMVSTIDQQAALQGFKGVETAFKMLNKTTVANEVYVPVKVINKEVLSK